MSGFSHFTRERQYLTNVLPATLEWYKHSFKWLPSESDGWPTSLAIKPEGAPFLAFFARSGHDEP